MNTAKIVRVRFARGPEVLKIEELPLVAPNLNRLLARLITVSWLPTPLWLGWNRRFPPEHRP